MVEALSAAVSSYGTAHGVATTGLVIAPRMHIHLARSHDDGEPIDVHFMGVRNIPMR
jgi:hypothetical protein